MSAHSRRRTRAGRASLRCRDHRPAAGATVNVGVDPSKVVITKLKMDKDRKARRAACVAAEKHSSPRPRAATVRSITSCTREKAHCVG